MQMCSNPVLKVFIIYVSRSASKGVQLSEERKLERGFDKRIGPHFWWGYQLNLTVNKTW